MIKISYIMRRLPHLSLEQFQDYWSNEHPNNVPPEAMAALGVRKYVQVLSLETPLRELVVGPRTGLVEPFDGVAEIWVDSLEALERWSSDTVQGYLQAFFEDEKNFIDWTRSTITVSREVVYS